MHFADPDLAALFAAVCAAPDDDGPRLVLADALEQRDDLRGRFISLQVRRWRAQAAVDPDAPDPEYARLRALERELFNAHAPSWRPPGLEGLQVDFSRGFALAVAGRTEELLARADVVVREVPLLEHVALADFDADAAGLKAFLASPLAARLRSFSCAANDQGLQVLSRAAVLSRVERLHVRCVDVTQTGAEAIGAGAWKLKALTLERSATGAGLRALLTPSLADLTLVSDDLGVSGARTLAEHGGHLRALRLTASRVGDEGAGALAASLSGLETLVLNDARVGVAGARALGASRSLGALGSLDVRENRLGKGGATGLLLGDGLPRLTTLCLRDCALKDAGVQVVARCGRPLARLDVRDNGLTDAGARELAKLQTLKSLNVNRNRLTGPGFAALEAALPQATLFGAHQRA